MWEKNTATGQRTMGKEGAGRKKLLKVFRLGRFSVHHSQSKQSIKQTKSKQKQNQEQKKIP